MEITTTDLSQGFEPAIIRLSHTYAMAERQLSQHTHTDNTTQHNTTHTQTTQHTQAPVGQRFPVHLGTYPPCGNVFHQVPHTLCLSSGYSSVVPG